MAMDIRKIRKIIELMKSENIAEIEITEGEDAVRISQFTSQVAPTPIAIPQTTAIAAPQAQSEAAPAATEVPAHTSGHIVKSPMVGTFYASPSPDAAPFVTVGQKVKAGDVLCILEAMKMFNQIDADKSGTIKAILVENGHPVEFDQPLFIIE